MQEQGAFGPSNHSSLVTLVTSSCTRDPQTRPVECFVFRHIQGPKKGPPPRLSRKTLVSGSKGFLVDQALLRHQAPASAQRRRMGPPHGFPTGHGRIKRQLASGGSFLRVIWKAPEGLELLFACSATAFAHIFSPFLFATSAGSSKKLNVYGLSMNFCCPSLPRARRCRQSCAGEYPLCHCGRVLRLCGEGASKHFLFRAVVGVASSSSAFPVFC